MLGKKTFCSNVNDNQFWENMEIILTLYSVNYMLSSCIFLKQNWVMLDLQTWQKKRFLYFGLFNL